MLKQDRGGSGPAGESESHPRVVKGPWDNLPKVKPAREPIIKRGLRGREAIVSNWRALAIFVILLIVAPPLVAWITRFVMGLLAQR